MKCPYCGEEMIELELYDLGYGQRGVEYECPNECELMKYLDENNVKGG
jgi:predicted RNA-binding Zn-ribbon protein involved in translation (DUF1610 family)